MGTILPAGNRGFALGCLLFYAMAFASFICTPVNADDTNVLFVTDDDFRIALMTPATNDGIRYTGWPEVKERYNALLTQAQNSEESLPAKDFPEGNWGPVTNGCQLSLRFTKSVFKVGEPVTATLLLRNVTEHTLNCSYLAFQFRVTSKSGKEITEPLPDSVYTINGSPPYWPPPFIQHKYSTTLSFFDFPKDKYTIRAFIQSYGGSEATTPSGVIIGAKYDSKQKLFFNPTNYPVGVHFTVWSADVPLEVQ
jgi:hypothetical protein